MQEHREASLPFYHWPLHGTPRPCFSCSAHVPVSNYTRLFSLTQLCVTGHHTCISEFYSLYFDVLWLLNRRRSLTPPNYRRKGEKLKPKDLLCGLLLWWMEHQIKLCRWMTLFTLDYVPSGLHVTQYAEQHLYNVI